MISILTKEPAVNVTSTALKAGNCKSSTKPTVKAYLFFILLNSPVYANVCVSLATGNSTRPRIFIPTSELLRTFNSNLSTENAHFCILPSSNVSTLMAANAPLTPVRSMSKFLASNPIRVSSSLFINSFGNTTLSCLI